MVTMLRIPGGRLAAVVGLLIAGASTSCVDRPPLGLEPGEPASVEELIAASWVGQWEGWGVLTEAGEPMNVADLNMRISFDADSIRKADCSECLTVAFEPWFHAGNLPFTQGDAAFLQYTEDGIIRSLTLQRFSGGGSTANSLLVKLRHERPDPAGTVTLVDADLEFRQR